MIYDQASPDTAYDRTASQISREAMSSWIKQEIRSRRVIASRASSALRLDRRGRRLAWVAWVIFLLCFGLVASALAYTEGQAKRGAAVFAFYCSTCHGDRGQGLTDEFRATWPVGDQYCWTPACHGLNPPDNGFTLPRYVPALVGSDLLEEFPSALSLFQYIKAEMPYQDPSLLTDQERWDVVAFLLRENGVRPEPSFRRRMPR